MAAEAIRTCLRLPERVSPLNRYSVADSRFFCGYAANPQLNRAFGAGGRGIARGRTVAEYRLLWLHRSGPDPFAQAEIAIARLLGPDTAHRDLNFLRFARLAESGGDPKEPLTCPADRKTVLSAAGSRSVGGNFPRTCTRLAIFLGGRWEVDSLAVPQFAAGSPPPGGVWLGEYSPARACCP
jgi:hypothetical protein